MNCLQLLMHAGFYWDDRVKGCCRISDRVLSLWYRMPNPQVAERELIQVAQALLRIAGPHHSDKLGHYQIYREDAKVAIYVHFAAWPNDLTPVVNISEGWH